MACGMDGGAQFPLLIEGVVAAVSREVLLLINGDTQASVLARDALQEAIAAEPQVAPQQMVFRNIVVIQLL